MDAVSRYLNSILAPRLRGYGVSEHFLLHTIGIIHTQMTSLLRHWDDRGFKNTVLLLGLEEGSFYEPPAKIDIRCFVVVAIRNSPIETIQSDACGEAGRSKSLSSKEVKEITAEAIRYFSKQDFAEMCRQAKLSARQDLYQELANEHPVAWAALKQLTMTSARIIDYSAVPVENPFVFEGWVDDPEKAIQKPDFKPIIYDAYTPEFDPSLLEILQGVAATPNSSLVVDSFKVVSRNAEKLMHVIEFLLTRNHCLVTSNFYLENGHVERRAKPLRAAHTVKEMEYNFAQNGQLGYKHKSELKQYLKQLKSE